MEPVYRSWVDCPAAEVFLTAVSVDSVLVTVFPTTVVSADTVTVFPTIVVSADTVFVTVFPTTVISVDTVFVTVFPGHDSRSCGHCLCDCVPHNSRRNIHSQATQVTLHLRLPHHLNIHCSGDGRSPFVCLRCLKTFGASKPRYRYPTPPISPTSSVPNKEYVVLWT